MKFAQSFACLVAAAVASCTTTNRIEPAPQTPAPAAPAQSKPRSAEHRWLHQLVGDWDVVYESGGPDGFRFEVTESVRSLGGTWIVSEGTDGDNFRSLQTLGFDTASGSFVGTWIDTMQTHLWRFEGALDEGGTVLHMHSEGPSMTEPGKTARYREALEFPTADTKRVTSSIQAPGGAWEAYMTAEGRRR